MILAQSVYTCKDTILTCAIEEQSLGKYLRGALPKHYPVPAIRCHVERNYPLYPSEWICHRCQSLWYGELAKTGWLPTSCVLRQGASRD